tara:strand:- start:644 stop:1753 length:1110 start_codon:yes stop_codon:yes gene_type:complete
MANKLKNIFKLKNWLFMPVNIMLIIFLSLQSCEKSGVMKNPYIDPQIIYSSYRWWNYDIFISDIYGGHTTHLTKNKWIDFNPSISYDGTKLAFISERDNNREIYIMDLVWLDGYAQWEGKNLQNLTETNGNEWSPRFSPNGKKLTYSFYEPNKDNYDIFIIDTDGANKKNLTARPGYEILPQFSPDGSFIIFQSWQFGVKEIFFINLLEGIEINLTAKPSSNDILTDGNSFSPNGEKIVFCSDRDGNKNIYIMNSNGSDQIQLTSNLGADYNPVFSPDGSSIVFTSNRDGNSEIYIMDYDGSDIKNISNNSAEDWNPKYFSNDKILFQSMRDGNWEIYIMKIDGSGQKNLTNHPRTDYSFIVLPNNNTL